MPRGKPKGSPKTGGRKAGTPNKDNPLKVLLHKHSISYFQPLIPLGDVSIENENRKAQFIMLHQGEDMVSQYEVDLFEMKPADRVNAELAMLKYHTPQMQAVSADMSMKNEVNEITYRIKCVANNEEITSDEV